MERLGAAPYNVVNFSNPLAHVFAADLFMNQSKSLKSIEDICSALASSGHPDLAQRITYFASDEDLEEGEAPVTVESVLGFWEFFQAVESKGRLGTGCTAEGQICADWRFEDERLVSIWFLDSHNARFAASYAPVKLVEIEGGGEVGDRIELTEKLVEAGLLTWRPRHTFNRNLIPSTTLPDTADADK